ncbi:PREDICTED: dynein intermediate chain 2, ciliary isoform X1 [Trachymyrmex septentrionalis]|uniref:dynein intermediate chain 2, ciliary isoform X1 n=1 Tax=Trachymyrmex septentrionalis TaxID=34720 RepID=UPI00084F620F|nr:PREDICTED: dynein intermediate chain 2, ciliary isoform X1 [Trachymyrmex septentrionalis]XP_018339750.1 PREDICTED: dynein intermediate chain 2, ciliary isoform X1 [Trachymyrmex septentrionalis]XP_018339760.1 PREDICTED: dynein intermediate chain 2, ciliary isoform X1 [Trachymyrmex septentrionalis]
MAKPTISKKMVSKVTETSKEHLSLLKSYMSRQDLSAGDMDWMRGKVLLKPTDQLQLTEAELQEEFARVLTIHNTRIPDSLVEWSWKLRQFVRLPPPPNLVTLLNVTGTILHKDSEEAKVQLAGGTLEEDDEETTDQKLKRDEAEEEEEEYEKEEEVEEIDKTVEALAEAERAQELEAEPEPEEENEIEKIKPKKIPNQFNFCERAALTYDNPMRDISTQTIPPPTATFHANVLQWTIFDEYQEDYAQQQREKEKEKKAPPLIQPKKEDMKKKVQLESSEMTNRMLQAAKTLERMVNQNIFDDISQDYRYWDDPSDEFKEGEGSLLPLWKFSYEKTKKHDITDMCFNSRYYDLFAVAFGSLSFNSPITNGTVCLFSLKNPSYPEWICPTESPVMCLDFNAQHPHLLVIGTMDGAVAVYNVMLPSTTPQYKSNDVLQKHGGLVWEIRWAPDTEEGNLAFFSVSIDGKINYWILSQSDLDLTTIMTLFLDQPPIPGPDGTMITLKGCGTCIAFHPADQNVFLVGTEEGTMYKCNTAYSSIYMRTYHEAHTMPVYRIVFNKYNSSIFASCSGDWRIKIWEDERPEPLFMFDLGVPIGDVQWAPYSSTVLACVSNDGKVTVFDLNVNKYRPICSQQIVSKRKNKLTRLAFNNVLPFMIVGDDKGTVNTLKLSPNLRIKVKPTKKQLHLSHMELESMKLEKLLSFVREPPVLTPPKDIRTVT